MAGKHIGSASLTGETTDAYAAARKVNSASRDALPALPIGDIGYGTPTMDGGARYAERDNSVPPPDGGGLAGPEPQAGHPADRSGMMGTSAAQAQPRVEHRKPTDDELMAKAMEMIDRQSNQHQALLSQTSLSPRDSSGSQVTDANGQKLPDWLVNQQDPDQR